MITCPACAEDLTDDATACEACGGALPAWVARLPISAPRASRRLEVLAGYLFVALAGAAFFIEAVLSIGLAFFHPQGRH